MLNEMRIAYGATLKAVSPDKNDGMVEGYLVPFTSADERDLHGEYFDERTDLFLNDAPVEASPVLYHHGHDPVVKTSIVGRFLKSRLDKLGLWVQAQLDMADEYAREMYYLSKQGRLGWSSGADPDFALVDGNGHIRAWKIREGSLTPSPAMPFRTRITTVKSMPVEKSLKELIAEEANLQTPEPDTGDDAPPEKSQEKESKMDMLGVVAAVASKLGAKLTGDQLAEIASAISGTAPADAAVIEGADAALMAEGADPKAAAPIKSAAANIAALATERIKTVQAMDSASLFGDIAEAAVAANTNTNKYRVPGSERSGAGGFNNGQAPVKIDHLRIKSRLGNVSPERLSFGLDMNRQLRAMRSDTRVKFGGSAGEEKTAEHIAKMVYAAHAVECHDKGDFALTDRAYEKAAGVVRHFSKANENDFTTQTGFGAEWVPEGWTSNIWPRMRRQNVVASRIPSFEMKTPIEHWPTDGLDGEAKFVQERTDQAQFNAPADKAQPIPTSEVIFNTKNKKLQRQVTFSTEELEDSIIKFDSKAEEQARRSIEDAVDFVVLNGDVQTNTTNINLDGASPASDSRYLIFDGIIKYALANTGLDMAGAAINFDKFIDAAYMLNDEIAGDETDTIFFTHPAVYGRVVRLDEVVTADKFGGSDSPNRTGHLRELAGVEILRTQQMLKSAANGKVSNTGGNNLFGRGVFVYLPYWKIGYRRRIRSKLSEAADGESYLLTVTTRFDAKQHSAGKGASLLYGMGI